jgi:hypothetical protein
VAEGEAVASSRVMLRELTAADEGEFLGLARDHERWAITVEMTDLPPAGPHASLPTR